MEGSATFTIAMSRTTMNCTAKRSASPYHLRCSEPIIVRIPSFASPVDAAEVTAHTFKSQPNTFICPLTALQSQADERQVLRPGAVLPHGPCAVAGGRALVAPDRPRAAARASPLHGSREGAARDRHEHPGGPAEGSRDVRRGREEE